MVAQSILVRRTLFAALAVLLLAAAGLVLWIGTGTERGAAPVLGRSAAGPGQRAPVEPGEAPSPGAESPGDAPAQLSGDDASDASGAEGGAGRLSVSGAAPASARAARLTCSPEPVFEQLFVGRGGALPLDSPAALQAAQLDLGGAGFVRRVPLRPGVRATVDGLEPGPLRVLLRSEEGRRVELEGLWLLPGETLDLGEVQAPRDIAFDLQVLGPAGLPVRDARVGALADRPGGAWRSLGMQAAIPLGLTDELGVARFRLAAGPWRLRIEAAGLAPLTSEGFVAYAPGVDVQALQVSLAAGAQVRGELIDPDELGVAGRPVASFSLATRGPSPEEALQARIPVEALAASGRWLTTAEGRLLLTGLAAGDALHLRALVGPSASLSHPDAYAPPTLARAGDRQAEVVQHAGAGLDFEVREVGSDRPVGEFSATLEGVWPAAPRRSSGATARWRDLRPLEAALDPLFADLPESPELRLLIEAEGYDERLREGFRLRTGEVTELGTLALHALPAVHLRLLAAESERPLEGAACELVAVLPEQAIGRSHSRSQSDSRGRAQLSVLANNAADLLVRRPGYAPYRSRAPAPNLAEQPFEVRLLPGARLRVRVLDGDRRPVRAEVLRRRTVIETGSALSEEVERQLTDADGWAEFGELAGGTALVAARALPRSDLDLEPPPALLTWTGAGVPPGGVGEIELAALRVFDTVLEPTWLGERLPHALVRLAPGPDGFTRPLADARGLLTGPVVRCDEAGRCVLAGLPAGTYSLRVEHERIPGFARTLLQVDGGSPTRAPELARTLVLGSSFDASGEARPARVVVWALGPTFYEWLEVEPGDSLRDLVPDPVVFADSASAQEVFALAVPPGIELIATAAAPRRSGDYYLEALGEGDHGEPIQITLEEDLELGVTPDRDSLPRRDIELGLVALHLDHPWGRGAVAAPFENGRLELGQLPRGRWRLCLVELAAGHLVLARGDWFERDLGSRREHVRLPWRAR